MRASVLLACLLGFSAQGAIYSMPSEGSRLLGVPLTHQVLHGESLDHIAQKYSAGFLAMMAANPGVDPYLPTADTLVTLPSQMILPDVQRHGIVINLAELRLYYFDKPNNQVYVYPIGIGRVGRETPLVKTKISQKIKDPTWTPTAQSRKEWKEERGIVLPPVVAAGPDNPMGHRALRLSYGNGVYLIHGTNQEFGIGLRVSAGCIRLRPDDIEELFDLVKTGDQVRIINEPVKVAQEVDGVYLEVHEPLSQNEELEKHAKTLTLSAELIRSLSDPSLDESKIQTHLRDQMGLPILVSKEVVDNK